MEEKQYQITQEWAILSKHLDKIDPEKYPVFSVRKKCTDAMIEYAASLRSEIERLNDHINLCDERLKIAADDYDKFAKCLTENQQLKEERRWISCVDLPPTPGKIYLFRLWTKWLSGDNAFIIIEDAMDSEYQPIEYGHGGYALKDNNDYMVLTSKDAYDYCDEIVTHYMERPSPPQTN
jgi:hypothetical protein